MVEAPSEGKNDTLVHRHRRFSAVVQSPAGIRRKKSTRFKTDSWLASTRQYAHSQFQHFSVAASFSFLLPFAIYPARIPLWYSEAVVRESRSVRAGPRCLAGCSPSPGRCTRTTTHTSEVLSTSFDHYHHHLGAKLAVRQATLETRQRRPQALHHTCCAHARFARALLSIETAVRIHAAGGERSRRYCIGPRCMRAWTVGHSGYIDTMYRLVV